MVVMEIHSRYGKLICQPMTLQAIENSILESEPSEEEPDLQASPDDGAQVIQAPSESSESEKSD